MASSRSFLPATPVLILVGVVLALTAGCAKKSELVRAQAEVAVLEEKIKVLEAQRVPKAELDRAEAVAAVALERTEVLEQELKGTRAQLAFSQEKASQSERRLTLLGAKAPEPVFAPDLVRGSFTQKDDTIFYSPDAQLNFGNGVMISSPSGLMLSDKERAIVAGDLVVETPRESARPTTGGKPAADGGEVRR